MTPQDASAELTREQVNNRFDWISRQLSTDQSTQDRIYELRVLALRSLSPQRHEDSKRPKPLSEAQMSHIAYDHLYASDHIKALERYIDTLPQPEAVRVAALEEVAKAIGKDLAFRGCWNEEENGDGYYYPCGTCGACKVDEAMKNLDALPTPTDGGSK